MNILIIGLGSIGQRHLRNLKLLLPTIQILAYRSSKNNNVPLKLVLITKNEKMSSNFNYIGCACRTII